MGPLGIGADLLENVTYDLVLQRAEEQVIALEVEASPFQRGLGGALKQLPRRVAEELGDVHALGAARRRLSPAGTAGAGRAVEEIGEELVEEAAAASEPA